MRSRVLTCLVALAALSFSLEPAHAADAPIVVIGYRSAYIDVTFERPVTVREIGTKITYEGSYAGCLIHPKGVPYEDAGENVAGGYVISGLLPPHYPQDPIDFGLNVNPTLEPGGYRLYLLGDGFARVTIPTEGLSHRLILKPRIPTRSYAKAAELPLSFEVAGSGRGRFPVETNLNTLSLSIIAFFSRRGATAANVDACFAPPGGSCDGRYGGTGVAFALVPDEWGGPGSSPTIPERCAARGTMAFRYSMAPARFTA